jgi:hypothetical protein
LWGKRALGRGAAHIKACLGPEQVGDSEAGHWGRRRWDREVDRQWPDYLVPLLAARREIDLARQMESCGTQR